MTMMKKINSTSSTLIIPGKGQIAAPPAALRLKSFCGIDTLVTQPQTAFLIAEYFHRTCAGMINTIAQNRFFAFIFLHLIHLLFG